MGFYVSSIRKEFQGYRWVNTYLFEAAALKDAHLAGLQFRAAEEVFHGDDVAFEQVRTAGYKSADPNDFIIDPTTSVGERVIISNNYAPPFVALHVRFASASGRPGKRFYRYALQNSEVFGAGDHGELDIEGTLQLAILDALNGALTWASSNGSPLMMGSPDGAAGAREVTTFSIGGVVQLDTHHGWFNRADGG